jgi:hypothetical protein
MLQSVTTVRTTEVAAMASNGYLQPSVAPGVHVNGKAEHESATDLGRSILVPGWEPNYVENDREFHGWRKGLYMYPCDEVRRCSYTARCREERCPVFVTDPLANCIFQVEKERMDITHALFLEARHHKLHDAPVDLNQDDTRVLDVGTGTGIWAIDMAE